MRRICCMSAVKNKAYQFRIYPNREQEELFARTFGCRRFVYNKILTDRIAYYEETKKTKRITPARYKSIRDWRKRNPRRANGMAGTTCKRKPNLIDTCILGAGEKAVECRVGLCGSFLGTVDSNGSEVRKGWHMKVVASVYKRKQGTYCSPVV